MKESVIVLGGGGHSKVVIEILRASGYSVEYCISASEGVQTCVGVPVLCGDHHLDELLDAGYSKVFPGIGSNLVRERAAERFGCSRCAPLCAGWICEDWQWIVPGGWNGRYS
jgi:UDP-perosamine 4-acetyltransferase